MSHFGCSSLRNGKPYSLGTSSDTDRNSGTNLPELRSRRSAPPNLPPRGSDTAKKLRMSTPPNTGQGRFTLTTSSSSRKQSIDAKMARYSPIRRSERLEKVTGSSSSASKELESSPQDKKKKKDDEKKDRKTSASGTRDESNAMNICFSESRSSKKRKWIDAISYRELLSTRPSERKTSDVSARSWDDNASVGNMVKSAVGDSAQGLQSDDECPVFNREGLHGKHCDQEANEVEGHSDSVSRELEEVNHEAGKYINSASLNSRKDNLPNGETSREKCSAYPIGNAAKDSGDSLDQEGRHECIKADASVTVREEFEELPSQELSLEDGLSTAEISLENKALSLASESAHRTTAYGTNTSETLKNKYKSVKEVLGVNISHSSPSDINITNMEQSKKDSKLVRLYEACWTHADIDSVEVENKQKVVNDITELNSLVSWLQVQTNKGAVQENMLCGIHSLSETVSPTSAKNGTSLPISNLVDSDVLMDQEFVITQSGVNSDNGVNHAIHREDASPTSSGVNKAYTLDSGGRGKLRDAQRSLYLLLKPEMLKLCEVLDLPDNVKDLAFTLLEYIMTNHQVDQQPETTTQALKISLCLRASSFLKYKINHQESLALAKKYLGFACDEEEVNMVYSKLRILKKKFHAEESTLKIADVFNDLECHSTDIEKNGRRPVGKTSSNSELYRCHESEQSDHGVDVGDPISKQKMTEKELASLKDGLLKSNIDLIDKICALRAREIHLKQQQEISELEIYEMKEELNIKKEYDQELMIIHALFVDTAQRSEKIRLLNEDLSGKMSRFKVHMNRQLDKLKEMQSIAWNKEQQIKDRWIQNSKVGQLQDSFRSIPLFDSGFRLQEFAELKEATIEDDLKNAKHSPIVPQPSPDQHNVDLIIIDSSLHRGSTGDNSGCSLFSTSGGVRSTPIHIQTSASHPGSAEEAEPGRTTDIVLEVSPIALLQEEVDLPRRTDNMVSPSIAMNTEGTETNSTLMADVANEKQGGTGCSDISLEEAGVPLLTDKLVSQSCAMITEAIETNRTLVADVAYEQHDGAADSDVSCLRLSPLLMDEQERCAGNDGVGHLTSSLRDGAESLQVYGATADSETGASLNQDADKVLQERPRESISLEGQDCRSAEDIQPSRSADVGSLQHELINNGMTASDFIQPVLSASSNIPSLGQREQSSAPASIENNEEPLNVMQCCAEPNDSPFQVPAGSSSYLELSAANELIIHGGPRQASAFLNTQNQEGTLNPMPCSAQQIDIPLPVSVESSSLPVQQSLPVEQLSQLVSHPVANPLLSNLDVSHRGTSVELATGHSEPVHFQLFPLVSLPHQGLQPEPLKNELTRIRMQQDKVSKMHDDRKLGIKREFEEEMEKLRKKYDGLLQVAESEFLENKTTLETIYNKVLMNHNFAEEFKAKFIENKGPQSPSFQGQDLLQGSQPQLVQRPVLTSSMCTSVGQSQLSHRPVLTSCMPTTAGQPQLRQRPVLTSSMLNSVGLAPPTIVAPAQVASVRLRGPASVVAQLLSDQTSRNTALNFQSNAVRPYFNSAFAPSANISVGSEVRAPAPHLHRFRPAPSLPSHNISIPTNLTASCQHFLTNTVFTRGVASLPANALRPAPVPQYAHLSPTSSPLDATDPQVGANLANCSRRV